ncbi:hypothetical protein [Streptomyces sp. NPDC056049]|uniref:hypothetical protein n=1 Tax=Streptomyces sp. NPDC056049 TaxID=3345693 RepID=UPI0035D5E1CE
MAVIQPNRQLVPPLPRQRRRYGLFNAATLIPMENRIIAAGLQFFADDCGNFTELYDPACGVEPEVKTPNEGTELVGTDPFWVETRLRCGTVGRTVDEIVAAGTARLESNEQWRVENTLWLGSPTQPGVLNLNDAGATVVTPLAPGAGAAISALENAFYQVNGYAGTIHVNTQAEGALEDAGMLNPDAGVLRTRKLTAVSLGDGYAITGPGGLAPAAGFVWAFITGYVGIWRSEDVMSRIDRSRAMDRPANQWDVIAERVYAAAWSCPEVFAVQVPVAAPAAAVPPAVPA